MYFLENTILRNTLNKASFQAGRISQFYSDWEKLTSDTVILNMVTGFKIPFTEIPQQQALPKRPSFTEQETLHIEAEITKLLKCRVFAKCENKKGDYFSNTFLRPKKKR